MTALRAVPDSPQVTLGDAVSAYLSTLNHPESAGTRRQYASILGRMARSIGEDQDVSAVTAADLAAWVHPTFGNRAPRTWNLALVALHSAWKHFGQEGWADAGAARGIPSRKAPQDRDRAIPRDVLEMLQANAGIGVRERALWQLLYETGARVSEVLRLDVQDMDMWNFRARVRRKAGASDIIIWQAGTAALLANMLEGRKKGPLFLGERKASSRVAIADRGPDGSGRLSYRQAENLFRRHTAKLPGGPYTLHQIRHSALTHAAEGGASTPMLMALSGHRNVKSLAIYARVGTDALAAWQADRDPNRRH